MEYAPNDGFRRASRTALSHRHAPTQLPPVSRSGATVARDTAPDDTSALPIGRAVARTCAFLAALLALGELLALALG